MRSMRSEKKKLARRILAGVMSAAICLTVAPTAAAKRLIDRYAMLFEGETASYDTLPSYRRVLAQQQQAGLSAATQDVSANLSLFTCEGETPEWLEQDGLEGLLLDEDTLSVTFPVTVPADGLYELEVMYYPYGGSGQAIRRTVSVDGTPPFSEAENLCLYRRWIV